MTYKLDFRIEAKAEWDKLDGSIRSQFRKKLKERLENPRVPSAALHNLPDCYKIKLRSAGYRLVYQVQDHIITITVISVGKRDKNAAYANAGKRI